MTELTKQTDFADGDGWVWHDAAQWALVWLPLIALPAMTLALTRNLAPWVFMWLLVLSIYAGFKWATFRLTPNRNQANSIRRLAYLLLWPGMDCRSFLDGRRVPPRPAVTEWAWAALKTALGVALLAGGAAKISTDPLLTGWIGVVGVALGLHFGLFELWARSFQQMGIDALPLMCSPVRATSISNFWGKRWNTAFQSLSHGLVFRPLSRVIGVRWAMLAAFLASGLVHDLVISLPAGGGYGRPTLYFLLQGLGVFVQRSRIARKIGLDTGPATRMFTVLATVGPVCLLFHPPFVVHVFLPFLEYLHVF